MFICNSEIVYSHTCTYIHIWPVYHIQLLTFNICKCSFEFIKFIFLSIYLTYINFYLWIMFSREKQICSSHSHVAFSSDLKFAHFPFTQLLTNLILSACKECNSCFLIPLIKYA